MSNAQALRPPLGPVRHRLRIYYLETRTELRRLLRNPIFMGLTVASPLMFYVILKLTLGGQIAFGSTLAHTYMVATYGTFGVTGISLGAVGMTIASERALGLMTLKRVSPMPPEAMIVGKLGVGILLNAVFIVLLFALGIIFGGARLLPGQWLAVGLILLGGTLPFAALGFASGYLGKDNRSISGFVNLLHLPMAFMSGLWIPLNMLPGFFQAAAPFLPHYHLAQLGLSVIGASYGGSPWMHLAVLAGYTLVFTGLAISGYKRCQLK